MKTSRAGRTRTVDQLLWLIAWISAAVTLYFSFGAIPPGTDSSSHADDVWHVIAYVVVVLSFLLAGVWRPGRGWGRWYKAGWMVILGAVLIGIAVELIQALVGRDAEVVDVVADLTGALIALMTWSILRGIAPRRDRRSTHGSTSPRI